MILYILGVIVALAIDYVIAKQFADIAEMKNHDGKPYFWYTFLFGIVGMLMVIALPVLGEDQGQKGKVTQLPPAKDIFAKTRTESQPTKRCIYCGDIVKDGRCEMCGREAK